ncbi:tetratricopeptide repeat protein [Coraliomargarita sp. W4R72]
MLLRASIIGLLLCLTSIYLSAAPKTDRIELYYGIAEGNYLIGDLQGAERGIEQMLRLNADYLPALTLKARVMLDQGKPEQALTAADQAISLEPENNEHTLLKALILGNMERRDEASTLIQQVIAQAPPASDDARAANQLLGLLRMAAGEWDQAATAFNNIYLADPTTASTSLRLSSEAYLEKARAEMQVGAHDEAVAAIDQAIDVYKKQTGQEALQQSTALRLMRARLLTQIGRFEAAIQDLQILTGQQPENYEALITLASLYASVERWGSLEAVIEPIAKRPELKDVALYLEGRAALAKNRVGTARAKFEAAIEALPKEADLLRRSLFFYRGICLQKLNRHEEAQTSILDAIDAGFRPETSEEALVASRTLLRADRANDAIPLLEAITLNRIEPGAAVWAMLGRAHLASETSTLALSAFNESLIIEPEQAEVRALRGSLLRKIGDLQGALADFEVAQRLAPADASIAYTAGLVYLQVGYMTKAQQSIAQAAQGLPQNAGLQLLHALLAYTLGDTDLAQNALKNYQNQITEKQNPSASYLDYLLHLKQGSKLPELATDEVAQYFQGTFTRKEALDASGKAETPEQARQQICATAFWLAQFEQAKDNPSTSEELLKIAVKMGNPDLIEYQLANWQLEDEL